MCDKHPSWLQACLNNAYTHNFNDCKHRIAHAAGKSCYTIYVHIPIDSLNYANHNAIPHLAAPFIAVRIDASIVIYDMLFRTDINLWL